MTREQRVKKYWMLACAFDRIPPETSYPIFSKDNPYVIPYDASVRDWLEVKRRTVSQTVTFEKTANGVRETLSVRRIAR